MAKAVILCVDDEQMILFSLKQQLKQALDGHYLVETAESGDEAMEIIEDLFERRFEVPLIICDQIMPGMKGDELLARIHTRSPKTFKILLTGQADATAVGNAVNQANLYRYIAKPWDQTDLILTVKEAIRSYFQDKKLEEKNDELNEKNGELEKLNTAYERFVPRDFLKFLGKESILNVELGDYIQKEMTVLFSDIRSFTALSESISPKDNFRFINAYLSRMEPFIRKNHGVIDKYIGDAIMALFPRNADDAVSSTIAMLIDLVDYNQGREKAGYKPIQIGVGIHTGSLMLGTVGAENRMDSTVISDAVNLSSRIEEMTKVYGSRLLVTGATREKLQDETKYHLRRLGQIPIRGKFESVSIHEVFDADSPELIKLKLKSREIFEQGLNEYHLQHFDKAAESFSQVLNINPNDQAARFYLMRSRSYQQDGIEFSLCSECEAELVKNQVSIKIRRAD